MSQRKAEHGGVKLDSESTVCRGSDFIEENDERGSASASTIYRQPQMQPGNFQPLTEAECREALKEFVKGHICYGSKPTKELEILSRDAVNSFRYSLRTFLEVRSFHIKRTPYKGGDVDGPENGQPPNLWDIQCKPKKMFFEHEVSIEVPHTAKLEKCLCCHGSGLDTCKDCRSYGETLCYVCNGRGYHEWFDEELGYYRSEKCQHCLGSGDHRTNHDDKCIVQESLLPDDLLARVEGTVLYQETNSRVQPITNFADDKINQESIDLIRSHLTERPNERIHAQRQTLYRVPITEVTYRWRNGNYRFWVYGNERCVYTPDNPLQCCFQCTLL